MCAACYLCFSFFPLASLSFHRVTPLPETREGTGDQGAETSRVATNALIPVCGLSSPSIPPPPWRASSRSRLPRWPGTRAGSKKKPSSSTSDYLFPSSHPFPPTGNFASAAGLRDSVRYFCCVRVLLKVVRCGVAAARRHRWIALLQGVFIRPSRRHRLRSGMKMFFLLPSFLPLGRECPVAPTPFPCSVRLSFQEWPPATHRSRRASVPRHAAPCGHPECQCQARAARGPFFKT